MKTLLTMMMAVMATLCVHGTTVEEARRILRAGIEESGKLDTPEKQGQSKQIWSATDSLWIHEGDLALSVYCELLAEYADNQAMVSYLMRMVACVGECSAESVNLDALGWARKVATQKESKYYDAQAAEEFLSYKGDASDLTLVSTHRGSERLTTRVAGTNIVEWFDTRSHSIKDNYFHFIPSVTNMGHQALYAREILHQYWETLPEVVKRIDDTRREIYRDGSKIPPELLTMVVWFDDDGNPVCNVDLSKYGLTMPEIDLPPKVKDEIQRRAKASATAAPLPDPGNGGQPPPEPAPVKPAPWKIPLLVGIAVIIGGAVVAWRRLKRK